MELTLFVDHQCNLRCSYCYTGDKFTRSMSDETMRAAVALALARSHGPEIGVSFFGGEPLLRLDFMRRTMAHVEALVASLPAPRPRVHFHVNTNATLIGDEAIALMAPPRRLAVYVSLDGDEATHDRFRVHASGKGSFADTMAGIARLREAAVRFHLVAVVTKDRARHLGEAIATLLPLGAASVHLTANHRDDWTAEAIDDLRTGLDDAGQVWMEAFRAGTAVAFDPLHTKILTHLKGGIPCPSRCQLGGREMCVSPAGHIYPCAQMVGQDDQPALRIGHVDHGFDEDARQRLQRQKERVAATCGDCELRDRCMSDCGCRHLALSGELGVVTEALCEVESAFIDAADRVAETLYAEQNEAFLDFYYRRPWNLTPGTELRPLRRARDAR